MAPSGGSLVGWNGGALNGSTIPEIYSAHAQTIEIKYIYI